MANSDDPPIKTLAGPSARSTGSETELINKIRHITLRVIRGQSALGRWQVGAVLWIRIVSIVLTAFGSAGLIADKLEQGPPKEVGWALYLWAAMLVVSIVMQIVNEIGINRIAMDSRLLAESSKMLEVQLENSLANKNPIEIVTKILTDANTMTEKYAHVLPERTIEIEEEMKRISEKLVKEYRENWELPLRQRRAK